MYFLSPDSCVAHKNFMYFSLIQYESHLKISYFKKSYMYYAIDTQRYVPKIRYRILTRSTSECDYLWRKVFK